MIKKIEIIKFAKSNYQPAVESYLTPKINVDNAKEDISLVKNFQGITFQQS